MKTHKDKESRETEERQEKRETGRGKKE